MSEPLTPYFSALVSPPNAAPAIKWFGTTWQEVVTRVEGFRLRVSDHIDWIINCTHDEERLSMQHYTAIDLEPIFLLYPGEFIAKVEVASNRTVVTGLRIHTSRRVTPWFGARAATRTSFEAPDGLCINAFRGAFGSAGCMRLGVVFAPRAIAMEGHSLGVPGPTSGRKCCGEHGKFTLGLRTCFETPRAIVVTMANRAITSVRVVSRAEYARLMSFEGALDRDVVEHWVVLVDEERIRSIKVGIADEQVVHIKFKTNMQTTPEFGRPIPEGASAQVFDCAGHAGRYIAGFVITAKGDLGADQTIVSIAVVYADEAAAGSEDAIASSEAHPSKAA